MRGYGDFDYCAHKLSALSDHNRLRMLIAMLESGEQTVSALAGIAGLNLAMASHHLSVLLDAGIVKARRQSRFVYYSLAPGVASHRGKMLNLGCCVVGFDAMEAAGQGDVTTNGAQAG